MPFGEGGFQPKSSKELKDQLIAANTTLGNKRETSLVPPSVKQRDILEMPLDEIQHQFARRYEMYVDLLRSRERLETTGEASLSGVDLAHMKKWLKALNSLDRYISDHANGEKATLYERQVTVFEDMRNFLEGGGLEGYVKLPTGVGKTVLFTELIEALDLKTLVIVPTNILISQTEKKFEAFAADLEVGKVSSKAKEFGRQVTITTYDSFVRQLDTGQLKPEDYDCLILDEAHLALSERRVQAIKQFAGAVKLGFTATPEYSHKKKVSQFLPHEIHRMTIREAIEEEGLLSPVSSILARTDTDVSNVPVTNSGEYDEIQLARAVNVAKRNKSAVDLYKKSFNGQLAIMYCVGIEHAEAVARMLQKEGVPAQAISGRTKNQEEMLAQFHEGKIKVLCNADLLIAGFDEPKASVCINLRPTRSRVVAEQRGGRVLRLDKTNPKKHAQIVDFVDQGIPEGKFPVLFADVAEGVEFKPKRPGPEIEANGGGGGQRPPIIDIPGLEVITDVEEIMRIVREFEKKLKKEFLSFADLRAQVQAAGIAGREHYEAIYKDYKGWPSSPNIHYAGKGWEGWNHFLGKEKRVFLAFADFQNEVRKASITGAIHYRAEYNKHSGWPASPEKYYADTGWKGWGKFLGKETKEFLSYSDLRAEVMAAGLHGKPEYMSEYKKYPDWPSNPDKTYAGNGWEGWKEFVGEETKVFLPFDDLQNEVLQAKIKDVYHYQEEYHNHPGWPSHPDQIYVRKGWRGWKKFLGKETIPLLSYADFQAEITAAGISGQREFKVERKKHPNWPSNPHKFYRNNGWEGWNKLLGKETKSFLTFDDLQDEVRRAGITNQPHYKSEYRKHDGWPSTPDRTYVGMGWEGWDRFLGKK